METKYISGLFVFSPNEKAPDFVKARLSLSPDRLAEWLIANKDLANEKGFIPVDILEVKDKKWYAKVNEFKPKPREEVSSDEISPEEIPF